jgi:hypothetical protein
MEWALFVKRPDELLHFEETVRDPHNVDLHGHLLPLPLTSEIPFSRTYYGNEYCEALIPSLEELEMCLTASLERGLSFTFITPHATDRYLAILEDCFELLATAAEGIEVVVSDWGVLRLLRRQYQNLTPVLGRMLNRAHSEHETSRAKNLTYFPYRRFLWNWGVKRIEFDCPVQLLGIDLGRTGLQVSIYFPHDCCVLGGGCEARRGECGRACRETIGAVEESSDMVARLRVDRLIYHSSTTA